MELTDLTIWLAKLYVAFRLIEIIFAVVIVVVVLTFVGLIFYKIDKKDIKITRKIIIDKSEDNNAR